jgi:hypothetical protein
MSSKEVGVSQKVDVKDKKMKRTESHCDVENTLLSASRLARFTYGLNAPIYDIRLVR